MTSERHEVTIGRLCPDGETISIAFELHSPTRPAKQPLMLFCTPGGGMRRGYYDLDGGPGTEFSFARAMTQGGHYVLALDPVGVGESTRPEDGFTLGVPDMADANRLLLAHLRRGEAIGSDLAKLPVVGVGHSAGAILTVMAQARGASFDALLLLCFGDGGMPEILNEVEKAAAVDPDFGVGRVVELARARFADSGYIPTIARDSDKAAARALLAVHDTLVANLGQFAILPGNVRKELAAIDVPVMVAVGDRDMTGPPHLLAQRYENAHDFTLYVLETSGHHLFVASSAAQFFTRTAHWLDGVAGVLNAKTR
ncbi:alpha/beta hydrolase [Croceicoccus estronivorus]|uniref:alpha/beta hydrolase n=1 Tax=Croceicoccus estronivorus TaxID=1172626 RepID=UPI000AEB1D73|nr:alpha/beta fold hydrolase [Croceicoccus estronivorus]